MRRVVQIGPRKGERVRDTGSGRAWVGGFGALAVWRAASGCRCSAMQRRLMQDCGVQTTMCQRDETITVQFGL